MPVRPRRRRLGTRRARAATDLLGSDFMTAHPVIDPPDLEHFLEEIRRLRSQVDAKQQLLNTVCHELRGPLHLARLCLGSALAAPDLTPTCREEIGLADLSLDRAAGMTRDLLEATRIDHGVLAVTPRPLDVGALVAETVAAAKRVARHRACRLVATVAAAVPPVMADPERVRQIASNLIDNALKFSPRHTTVLTTVAPSLRSSGHVEIAVADEGHGVDLATAEKLFERFHQSPSPHSRKGIGLGLYLCRELVRRHGGEIWVENVPGAGARFAFTLPVATAVASAA